LSDPRKWPSTLSPQPSAINPQPSTLKQAVLLGSLFFAAHLQHGKVRAACCPAPRVSPLSCSELCSHLRRARRLPAPPRRGGVGRRPEKAVPDLHLPRRRPEQVCPPHSDPRLRKLGARFRLPHCNPPAGVTPLLCTCGHRQTSWDAGPSVIPRLRNLGLPWRAC